MVTRVIVQQRPDPEAGVKAGPRTLLVCSACGSKVTAAADAPLVCPRCGTVGAEPPRKGAKP